VIYVISIAESKSLSRCADSFQSVYNFLRGTDSTVSAGRSTRKPLLVCGDSWTLRQSMNDEAYGLDSTDRRTVMKDKTERPLSIKQVQGYAMAYDNLSGKSSREIFPVSYLPNY
jgi:hypothetical protein